MEIKRVPQYKDISHEPSFTKRKVSYVKTLPAYQIAVGSQEKIDFRMKYSRMETYSFFMPTTSQDVKKLKALGHKAKAARTLEVFPNHASKNMEITLHCQEFTCLCPVTGQPDYAEIELTYTPNKYVVESKSMKLYLETYPNEGVFHEHLAVDIARDFIKFVQPLQLEVAVHFHTRGGIAISAKYRYKR